MENQAATPQSNPHPGKVNVVDYVIRDIEERVKLGEQKYGTRLQTFNGRNALIDAYQEALDLVMYLRQKLLEEEAQEKILAQYRDAGGIPGGHRGCPPTAT